MREPENSFEVTFVITLYAPYINVLGKESFRDFLANFKQKERLKELTLWADKNFSKQWLYEHTLPYKK